VIDTVRETAEHVRSVWEAERNSVPMAAKVVEAIDAHAPTIELYRKFAEWPAA
jgi:serine/threonine-protein kinase HipA